MTDPSAAAIVVAAGRGERLGGPVAKPFVALAGRPLLARAVDAIAACPLIERIVVVTAAGAMEEAGAMLRRFGVTKVSEVIAGGSARQESVAAGLARVADPDVVVVHDGARPLVTPEIVAAVIRTAAQTGAASAGVPMHETVKRVDGGDAVATVDRQTLWIAHTPQAFHPSLLRTAHQRAEVDGFRGSDDAILVERIGHRVRMVEDSPRNLKITVADDLRLAEAMVLGAPPLRVRTGMGIDAHRLVMNRPLRLGGVEIPSPRGLAGHSDADVLLHAVMDALLGAAGLGDIGIHFPVEDPAYRGADSLALLGRVRTMVEAAGWQVVHVDCVVLAEAPRIAPYVPEMQRRIAPTLGVGRAAVSIKATTMEGLGAVGRGEGITAYALATIAAGI